MNLPVTKQQQPVNNVAGLLLRSKDQIAAAVPKHLSPDRLSRIALTEIRKNPSLGECDPLSFLGAIIQCAQLGLEPGSGLGHAYLIPFKRQVTLVIGYQGQIDLAMRSGKIDSIIADVAYRGDEFDYYIEDGLQKFRHRPIFSGERKKENVVAVYAVAKIKGGGYVIEVMAKEEIDYIEKDNRKGGSMSLVWQKHWSEMAKKTVIRRIYKKLPKSVEMADAHSYTSVEHEGPDLRRVAEDILQLEPEEPEMEGAKTLDDLLETKPV